ncbi:MAG: Sulfite reductase [NADPH] flavoprotein alpha-component [Stenotrophomonas maltophilia]|nr:MAG: Sulfite reductase [NADPH] flavoprotein alpha-component [Stenotrophomonas maltophilia]
MLKKVWFQLHWVFGISAGLVLALMGVTGAIMSFQDELMAVIDAKALVVQQRPEGTLPLDELVRRVNAAEPGKQITFVLVRPDSDRAARIFYAPPPGERRGEGRYVDPYTGAFLPQPASEGFFMFVMILHRFLAAGSVGQQITGASTLILVYLSLSGLYLRWPRQWRSLRTWLTFDWRKKGRAFNWDLHAVFGTWCLAFYLLASLTGLYWSYDWYRAGLFAIFDKPQAGEQRGGHGGGKGGKGGRPGMDMQGPPLEVDYSALWTTLRDTAGPHMTAYNLRLPPVGGQPATVFYLLDDAGHDRALNEMSVDPKSGRLLSDQRYNDQPLGKQLLTSIYSLHIGSYFGLTGRILMMLASLSMPLFFITGWLLYLDRRRKKRAARGARVELNPSSQSDDAWLVGYASQSGFAEQLAWQSAGQLQAAGLPVRVEALANLTREHLQQARNALFVVSTFGDGEAPDAARGFERKLIGQALSLGQLRFATLALGDRQYEHFCAFARRLQGWLQGQGAHALFDSVEVDNGDAEALLGWQQRLAEASGAAAPAPYRAPTFDAWTLTRRECLNPDSEGGSTWLIDLRPPAGTSPTWQAGDLLEVLPLHPRFRIDSWLAHLGLDPQARVTRAGFDEALVEALANCQLPESHAHLVGLHAQAVVDALVPLAVREYSIASIPADGDLQLIVRQERHGNKLGIASGWLSAYLPMGGSLAVRLRRNAGFHLMSEDAPLVLIGNGSGLAGLRSLLHASVAAGRARNWLLFGERNRAHDFYCREELDGLLASGALTHLDLAFSRDQDARIYVQDVLREQAQRLREWVAAGAYLYVCGSLEGMAAGVDKVLREILGEAGVDALLEDGRYRRDVY